MPRKPRPFELSAIERQFRMDTWVERHMTIDERSGPEWVCVCPMCGRTKLAVHVGRKVFQCLWAGCQFRSWRPRLLVAAVLGVSWEDADAIIAAHALGRELGPIDALASPEPPRAASTLPQASLPPVRWELMPTQAAYVRSRGVPEAHAAWLGLATCVGDGSGSKADRVLRGRVLFPVWNHTGRLVFWVARDVSGRSKAKTVNMPRACRVDDHGRHCACYHEEWGLPPVPESAVAAEVIVGLHGVIPGQPVIVVEGPMDVAVCGPQFVGTLGAHLTQEQAALIAATGASEAIILFDGDQGGWKAAPKAGGTLGAVMPTRWTTCPTGEDPGTLGRALAWSIALAAPPLDGMPSLVSHRQQHAPKVEVQPPFISSLKET